MCVCVCKLCRFCRTRRRHRDSICISRRPICRLRMVLSSFTFSNTDCSRKKYGVNSVICLISLRSSNVGAKTKKVIVCVGKQTFASKEFNFSDNKWQNVTVRIHDACITSEAFHSVKCDCRLQLQQALKYITQYAGMVVYLNQEGADRSIEFCLTSKKNSH